MFRQIEFFCRPFKAECSDVVPQYRRCFIIDLFEMRVGVAQCLPHPYRLRALAGKYEADSLLHKRLDIFEMPWKVNGKSSRTATTLLTLRPTSIPPQTLRASPE